MSDHVTQKATSAADMQHGASGLASQIAPSPFYRPDEAHRAAQARGWLAVARGELAPPVHPMRLRREPKGGGSTVPGRRQKSIGRAKQICSEALSADCRPEEN